MLAHMQIVYYLRLMLSYNITHCFQFNANLIITQEIIIEIML